MQSEWNGIDTRDDQLVVALVVGKGGRPKGLRREQLGIRVGDPARRLLESLGVHVGTEPAQKVASRALHRVVVDRRASAPADGGSASASAETRGSFKLMGRLRAEPASSYQRLLDRKR